MRAERIQEAVDAALKDMDACVYVALITPTVNEPLQFYSGKDPMLFEIVVNNVSAKNTVTGYLSSPKGAPESGAVAER